MLLLLIVAVVIGAIALCAAAFFGATGLLISEDKARQKAERGAAEICDRTFAGKDAVIVEITPRTLSRESMIIGATARGYDLASETTGPGQGCYSLTFLRDEGVEG